VVCIPVSLYMPTLKSPSRRTTSSQQPSQPYPNAAKNFTHRYPQLPRLANRNDFAQNDPRAQPLIDAEARTINCESLILRAIYGPIWAGLRRNSGILAGVGDEGVEGFLPAPGGSILSPSRGGTTPFAEAAFSARAVAASSPHLVVIS
jgi:hypothetical protein